MLYCIAKAVGGGWIDVDRMARKMTPRQYAEWVEFIAWDRGVPLDGKSTRGKRGKKIHRGDDAIAAHIMSLASVYGGR